MTPIIRGDDTTINVQITQTDTSGVITPFDITGSKVWFTIKKSQDDQDSAAIFQQPVTTHDNAVAGLTHFTITHTQSGFFALGNYYYDIQIKLTNGTIFTIIRDNVSIVYDITQTIV